METWEIQKTFENFSVRISLSFIKEECPAIHSESLTTEAAFFPTKAELSIFISLRVSLDLIRCLR
jgi:hypothetical protein